MKGWALGMALWLLQISALLADEPAPAPAQSSTAYEYMYRLKFDEPPPPPAPPRADLEPEEERVAEPAAEFQPALAKLQVLWERELPDVIQGGVAAGDGSAYVALQDETLRAFRLTDGQQRWKRDLGAVPQTGAAYVRGVVLVVDIARRLRAFSAATGNLLWETVLQAQASSEIGVSETMVCVGEGNKSCAAFNLADGRKLWQTATLGDVIGAPWIGEKVVLFGSTGHKLYAVAKLSGEMEQETILTGEVYGRAGGEPGTADSALAAVGTHDGRLHAFSTSGVNRWTARCRGVVRAAPLVNPEAVYAGTDQALLYKFDRKHGDLIWRTGIGGPVVDNLFSLGGHLIVGAGVALKFVDPETGEIDRVIAMDGLVRGVDEEDGTVVAVTTNRRLVAVGFRYPGDVAAPPRPASLVSVVVDSTSVNPRRGQRAAVSFSLLRAEPLTVDVVNMRGKRVKLLANYDQAWPDTYYFTWGGLDEDGGRVVPGVYRIRVIAGEEEVSVGLDVVGRR